MNNFLPSPPVDTLLDLAEEQGLNISDEYMENIINGSYPISFIATLLSEKFNTTVEFWLAREGCYIKALNNKIQQLENELIEWKRYDAKIEGIYYGKSYTGFVKNSTILNGLIVYLVELHNPIIINNTEKQSIFVVDTVDDYRFSDIVDGRELMLQWS